MEREIGKCGGGGSVTPVGGGGDESVGNFCCHFCTETEVSLAGIICACLV
jgi:hypothetical protein